MKKYKYLNYMVLDLIERKSAWIQGKGYGASSIKSEVRAVSRFMGKSPRLAIDIGGNVGDYSVALKEKYPLLDIHIFEPSKINVKKLKNRFSNQPNIKIEPRAVSDRTETATLYTNEFGSGLSSLSKRKLDHFKIFFDKEEKIDTIRFEDYWINELESKKN